MMRCVTGRRFDKARSASSTIQAVWLALALVASASPSFSQVRPERARDLGVPLDGTPGPYNAITDVAGVEVGHTTLISGSGKLVVGQGPVRTGVTVVHPRGKANPDPVMGAWFNLNGNGEMTGTAWIDDYGLLLYPIAITNTNSVGRFATPSSIGGKSTSMRVTSAACRWWRRRGMQTERHLRLPREAGACVRGHRLGSRRAGSRGKCWGWHRDGVLRFQGRNRHVMTPPCGAAGGYTVGVLVQCNSAIARSSGLRGFPWTVRWAFLLPATTRPRRWTRPPNTGVVRRRRRRRPASTARSSS